MRPGTGTLRPRWRAVRRKLAEFRWLVVTLDIVVAATLGYTAFGERYPTFPVVDRAFMTFKLFLFDPGMFPPLPWRIRVALVLAPAVTAYASFRMLTSALQDQWTRLRVRLFVRNHVIVCGVGDAGARIAVSFAATGIPVVVVDGNPVANGLGRCRDAGCIVLIGNLNDETTLRQAEVAKARYVVAVTSDDTVNAAVAATASRLCKRSATCVVRVSSPELCNLLREATMRDKRPQAFRVEFFNEYDAIGPALYAEYGQDDGEGVPNMAVIGLGELGSRLVVHAARTWSLVRGDRGPIELVVGGPDAQTKVDDLVQRFPALCSVAEVTVLADEDALAGRDHAAVFVCLDDDTDTMTTAMRLWRLVRPGTPVIGCTAGAAELMGTAVTGEHPGLECISILDHVSRADVVVNGLNETVARAIHESYIRNEKQRGHTVSENASMVAWDDLPESLRESNRAQAESISSKLAEAGYEIEPWREWDAGLMAFPAEEIERMARFEHGRWWAERKAAGWKLGPERDAIRKTNPYLIPYDELPENVRELDRDTVRDLPDFLAKIGYRIVARPQPRTIVQS